MTPKLTRLQLARIAYFEARKKSAQLASVMTDYKKKQKAFKFLAKQTFKATQYS